MPLGVVVAAETVAIVARGLAAGPALTAPAVAAAGPSVRVQIAGGTDGESYLVTVDATGSDGGRYEAEAEVHVADLGFAAPDGSVPYASVAQLVDRLGLAMAIRLTDSDASGRVGKAPIVGALTDAQATVDGYVAAAGFDVPLPVAPGLVTTLVLDLATARLYGDGVPAGVAAAKADALAQLKAIAAGQIKLPLAATTAATPVSPTPIFTAGPDRVFSRDTLWGF